MLVEIILGKETGDEALAVALDYVRAISKTPIVVNDSRGFYTSRVVGTYLREGHLMLTEGVPAAMIENVGAHGRHAGRPAVAQRRGRGRSRLEDPEGDRSRSRRRRGRSAGRRRCWRRWWRSAAGSAARTARASTTIRRAGRSGCGPGSPICSRASSRPTRIDVARAQAPPARHPGAGDGALLRGRRAHRRARGRCRLDPRLRLRAVFRAARCPTST